MKSVLNAAGLILLIGGALLMLLSAIRFLLLERRRLRAATEAIDNVKRRAPKIDAKRKSIAVWLALTLLVAAGAYLRLEGLDEKTLSHPETYVPGINLPADISEPPPRETIVPLVYFHFHGEPHPPLYYFLMFGWTKLFGASLVSLRLPSVIVGVLSIPLVFALGRMLFGARVALLGAAFIAFNGHHIYWSQTARMYALNCFLGLLSTVALIKTLRSADRNRVYWGAAYLLFMSAGVYTDILFWALLAGQMFFLVFRRQTNSSGQAPAEATLSDFAARLQSLVVMLGAPMLAHAIYTGRSSPLESPSAIFLGEALSFGFLFERDVFSLPTRAIPETSLFLLAAFAVGCVAAAFIAGNPAAESAAPLGDASGEIAGSNEFRHPKRQIMLFAALGSLVSVAGFALLAREHRSRLFLVAFISIAAPYLPVVGRRARDFSSYFLRRFETHNNVSDSRFLLASLFFVPLCLIFTASFFNSLMGSRLLLLFTPYLLLLIAVGAVKLMRHPAIAVLFLALFAALYGESIAYYKAYPSEEVDYKDLALAVNSAARRGDAAFVHKGSWITTPVFYYLDGNKLDLIAEDFSAEVERQASPRVWLINFEGQSPSEEMCGALVSHEYKPVLTVSARRANAVLYEAGARSRDASAPCY